MDLTPNGFTMGAFTKGNFQYTRDIIAAEEAKDLPFSEDALDQIPITDKRWAWVEVSRSAIQHNVRATKALVDGRARLMAVVKADAYGHGAVEVAKAALNAGASNLGVATVDEGIQLRDAGLTAPILILAEPPITAAPLLLHYQITPAVYSADFAIAYAEEADRHGKRAPYHLAINTGMNRIGVPSTQVVEFAKSIGFHRALDLEGCFTHFATADAYETLDFQMQISRFVDAMRALESAGIDPGIVHCCNSAAIYRFPKTHFDMVRLGISLYGYHPAGDTRNVVDLRPAMSVYAKITNVSHPGLGEGVSYGLNYRCTATDCICTVPLGYADGLMRILSGQTEFAWNNLPVRQVGNICMDQCMFAVDMRSTPSRTRVYPQVGDMVQIAGPSSVADCSIDALAYRASTIPHEITIGFGHRLDRIYV